MQKKSILSLLTGNVLEHYDTALFALLTPKLAPLFFPKDDPVVALILTYAMIPLGLIAKPLGALFFGRLSDVKGRKHALLLSLFGMSVATCGFAVVPSFDDVGPISALFLAVLRLLQSFFASGESISGAILLLEKSPQGKHTFLSSLWDSATVGGILLASFAVMVMNLADFNWRWLYLIGSGSAFIGFILRFTLPDSEEEREEVSLKMVIYTYRKEIALIALNSGFSYASYMVALVLMNALIPLVSPHAYEVSIAVNTALLVFDMLLLPMIGYLSSRLEREKIMQMSAFAAVILGIPAFMLLEGASFALMLGIRMLFVIIGVGFSASFHAWCQHLIPKAHRGLAISFGYSLGTQALGAGSAALSLWLYKSTGSLMLASSYWVLLAFCSLASLNKRYLFLRKPHF